MVEYKINLELHVSLLGKWGANHKYLRDNTGPQHQPKQNSYGPLENILFTLGANM